MDGLGFDWRESSPPPPPLVTPKSEIDVLRALVSSATKIVKAMISKFVRKLGAQASGLWSYWEVDRDLALSARSLGLGG